MIPETLAPGTVFQGRYELLSLLRESNPVVVYQGRQIAGGPPVVLQVVRLDGAGVSAGMARRCRARFLREMRSCARLHHPGIVRPIDVGQTDDGQVYAVSELVPGRGLAELLSDGGALDPQETRHLMLQVLDVLAYAHRQGIVHGDLRPAHVMVVPAGARREARVLNFGFGAVAAVARAGQDSAPVSGTALVGSRVYAAPEQLRGLPPMARSDLYSWGLVFLECLTGKRSASGGSSDRGAVEPGGGVRVRIPPALREHPLGALLRRATSADVAARAATADELLHELDACDVGELRREELVDPGEHTSDEERPPEERTGSTAPTAEDAAPPEIATPPEATLPPEISMPPEAPAPSAELVRDFMPLDAGAFIKHYEIIRKLGQGGMGVVFLARDTKLGRLVAVKLLLRHSEQGIARFLDEARVTARCRHENIVDIHEVDELRGHPYIVLEYVKGRTLRRWMAEGEHPGAPESAGARAPSSPIALNAVIELMIPVARALVCAHEQGIVHRDLKPENVLLDDAGCIKVVDFGIAKRIEAKVISTMTGARAALGRGAGRRRRSAAMGTLPYMSPEQLLGLDVDARTDLWAVGIMLHELLTGRHPLDPFSVARVSSIVNLDVPMPSLRQRHPDVGMLGALVDRCLEKRKDERLGSARELLAELEALVPGRKALDLGEGESPFAGLSAFQEADAARFFGRDRDSAALMAQLRSQPFLAVAGPSGAGKSSFVRAGVIPALKGSGGRWEAFVLRPGRRPLSALVDVLAQVAEAESTRAATAGSGAITSSPELPDHDELAATLRAQPGHLGARLRARCRREGKKRRILLFVDQFEELYTLGATPEERAAFVACLEGAADDASSPLRVLLAIRSDFLDRMAEDRNLMTDVTRGLWFLPPMGREGLRDALTRPIEAAGYRFETAEMVEHMLGTLESTPSPLPLLQFTAAKLWEARDRARRLLTQGSYDQLGGVAGALSAHADAVLSAFSVREQRLARAVLLRLVTPERTRAVVSLDELREIAQEGEGSAADAIVQVAQHLAGARLLLIEPGGEGATVELVHESLIERWAKLKQWLTEGEHDAQFLARLRAAAEQWEANGRAEGLLWHDRAAEDARAWYERRRAAHGAAWRAGLGARDERYLRAVVALVARARRLRRRLVIGVTATLGAIAIIVSFLAISARQEATRAERQATRADQEAARAQADARRARNATRMAAARELQADPTAALALLREIEPPDVPRGWASFTRSVLYGGVALEVFRHPDSVSYATYSPDGKRIVTTSSDNAVRLWNADGTGEPLVLRGHEGAVSSAAFSPDGKRILTASRDKTARVWNADGKGEPLVLRGHESEVTSAAFSPDGKRILTASRDKTARVWNADGKGEPLVLRGHESEVTSAAFSPDGKRILTASTDNTAYWDTFGIARVWNADGKGEPLVLGGHESDVTSAAFSPDGKRILTVSSENIVRVRNVDGKGEPLVLGGHKSDVRWAAFSPDGKRILTVSSENTVRVRNADGKGEPLVLGGHESDVRWAAFSPDGKRIVTASEDNTARVWNADSGGELLVLRGHQDAFNSAAFSPDGKRIVTASRDKTVRVWNADRKSEPLVLRGHEESVESIAFSPDGKRIVTASEDNSVRLWNADRKSELLVLRGHEESVDSVAFSPDGKRIVTASEDKTARVWNADGGGEPLVLRGHEESVDSVAFSPDGKRIVTASSDKTARVWNADGGGEFLVLRGHEDDVHSAAFSPDGKRIVTASSDKTARVWNADGGDELLVLHGHADAVSSAAFSPDGKRIVTASEDKTARVWNVEGEGDPLVLTGSADTMSTAVAFSPDGTRILIASKDSKVHIWNADGTGKPLVLTESDSEVTAVAFSPDGKGIAIASIESGKPVVNVWSDLNPPQGVGDPRLWTATAYCMPLERRVELLGVDEAAARTDREACLLRVKEARAAALGPQPGSAGHPGGSAGP
ncbi:protein kinase [Sorangium sp. So ce291]|uniref:nSTAND1 domain-containing NTPase n=1 Tax=Sorangium sp. So ce291 TaxID=3133294 RepID=UPI003F60DA85